MERTWRRSFLEEGQAVQILDNLSRPGVERNIAELSNEFGANVEFVRADIRDSRAVERAVSGASAVFHLAAQVAVTTSIENPVAIWKPISLEPSMCSKRFAPCHRLSRYSSHRLTRCTGGLPE